MNIDVDELKTAIRDDKARVAEAIKAAREKSGHGIIVPVAGDITGHPSASQEFIRDRRDTMRELAVFQQTGAFARVDVTFPRDTSPTAVLITKARCAGEIEKDGEWKVISYTSPLYAHILDRDVGSTYQLENGRGGTIGSSSKFESILPTLTRGEYRLTSGLAFVEHEEGLDGLAFSESAAKQSAPYQAAENYALGEIIELADPTQRSAMHFPFSESVLVEGPPGSGKTSVAIMRIPCLIDRQWDELGLDQLKHVPFHANFTMRVLVLSDEMVDYLGDLVRSLRIEGVVVETIHNMLLRICSEAGLLRGRSVREPASVAQLKLSHGCAEAYWSGFARHVGRVLETKGPMFRERCEAEGTLGASLWSGLQSWSELVENSTFDTMTSASNFALRAAEWYAKAMRSIPEVDRKPSKPPMPRSAGPSSKAAQRAYKAALDEWDMAVANWEEANTNRSKRLSSIATLRDVIRDLARHILDRAEIVRAMFQTDHYSVMLEQYEKSASPERASDADVAWREQYEVDQPARTEADTVLTAWLAMNAGLVPSSGPKAVVGDSMPSFTHLVVDEAQDLSPIHAQILRGLVDKQGTLTLVGDLRQRLQSGGLSNWDELGIDGLRRAAFTVNHRQSFQLGSFVGALHEKLFHEGPVWKPSERRHGPAPRLLSNTRPDALVRTVATEIRHWREDIQRSTVAVLFDGQWAARAGRRHIRRFLDELSDDLATDSALTVEFISSTSQGGRLRRTNCVLLASVKATKGLEFDAVVLIDPREEWKRDLLHVSTRKKNGLYVGASRAKQGLSLVMSGYHRFLVDLADAGLCEHIMQ